MEIVLVQPTDLTPKYMTHDFWEVCDESGFEHDRYYDSLRQLHCDYDSFDSFKEAEEFLIDISASGRYKQDMMKRLNRLKEDAKIFRWAVA